MILIEAPSEEDIRSMEIVRDCARDIATRSDEAAANYQRIEVGFQAALRAHLAAYHGMGVVPTSRTLDGVHKDFHR